MDQIEKVLEFGLPPQAIITFGLPGSGKTTLLKSKYLGTPIISADDIKPQLLGWDEKNPSVVHQQSVKIAKELVEQAVKEKIDFAFDSGSINTKYSRNLFKIIKESGYHIHLVVFDIPLEVCLERNKKRSFQVPEHDILSKNEEKSEALLALMPYVDTIETVTLEDQTQNF